MSDKLTEDEIATLEAASANLRGGSSSDERRVEAAFRIAYALDQIVSRLRNTPDKNT